MHEISQSLYRLCQSKGAEFQLSNAVTEILHDGSKITGVVAGSLKHEGDLIVCNMDIYATYQRLLKDVIKPKKTLAQERSSSALIFYWGIKKTF